MAEAIYWLVNRYLLIFACALVAMRFVALWLLDLPLFYDEAYYHFWSQDLAFGYYSKPPVVAWLIALTTTLAGVSEWSVRISSPVLYILSSLFVYLMGRQLIDKRVGIIALVIFLSTPLVTFNSLFITTDAPLLFFWALTAYLYLVALDRDRIVFWIMCGASGGMGLLSKYTMGLLAVGLLLHLWLYHKHQLISRGPWIAVLVAFLIFSMNLVWNYEHDFISFQHTSDISQLSGQWFHPEQLVEFLLGQFLVFGPVSMGILLFTLLRPPECVASRFLMLITLPLLLLITTQALLARAHMNWAAPAYIGGSVWVAVHLARWSKQSLLVWALGVNLIIAGTFYSYSTLQQVLGIETTETNTPLKRVSGWRGLFNEVDLPQSDKDLLWVSDSRKLLSYAYFYLSDFNGDKPIRIASFNPSGDISSHFDLFFDVSNLTEVADNYIFLSEHPRDFEKCFRTSVLLDHISHRVFPTFTRELYVYQLSGFRGYERCTE